MGFARLFRCSRFFLGGVDEVPENWSWQAVKNGYTIYRKHHDKDT